MIGTNSPAYEKGFEDGFRDGFHDAAARALPVLRLCLDRLDLNDGEGEEQEYIAQVSALIADLEQFAPKDSE